MVALNLEIASPVAVEAAQRAAENPRMNLIDAVFSQLPQVEAPVIHRQTPGMYTREILMRADSFVTSKIHKTEHQFVVLSGDVSVWTEEQGVVRLTSGHVGITQPGTRRLLYAHSDTRWITFHPTMQTNLDKIEEELIHPHTPANDSLLCRAMSEISGGSN